MGDHVFSAGCDNKVMCQDLRQQKLFQVALHDKPVRKIKWVTEMNVLVTGGWDNRVRLWDCRSSKPGFDIPLPERCYALDVKSFTMVVATAGSSFFVVFVLVVVETRHISLDRKIGMFDLRKVPSCMWIDSPLKFQSRSLGVFPDGSGFALGSIEGRVAVHYLEPTPQGQRQNFAFKCHRRNKTQIFAVNGIDFHPHFGTFATCGSDGTFHFWDKDSKQRLKGFKQLRVFFS